VAKPLHPAEPATDSIATSAIPAWVAPATKAPHFARDVGTDLANRRWSPVDMEIGNGV